MNKLIYLLMPFLILYSCNQNDSAIQNICPDCKTQIIEETDLILVTNSQGLSNLFNTTNQSLVLSNFMNIKYNPGIFFDDLEFNMNGNKAFIIESEFDNISDAKIKEAFESRNESNVDSSDGSSRKYCSKHSKMYNSENGCTECLYDSVEDDLNKPGGFRERASHL